jgi:hypothetical protein
MITLSDGTTTVALHKDLYWGDEFTWRPVEQTKNYTLTGAMVVMASARKAGRHITLAPEDDSSAWMPLATVTALRNWAAAPGKQMTLTLRGITYMVLFRHEDGGLDATPVQHRSDTAIEDFYRCTVRLLEI